MSEVEKRGMIRLLIIVSLVCIMVLWRFHGFWDALQLTGMIWISSILIAGVLMLTYETESVIEWLGKLKFR